MGEPLQSWRERVRRGSLLGLRRIEKKGKRIIGSRDICLLHIASSPRLRELVRSRHPGFEWVTRYVARIATLEPWPFHLATSPDR